MQAFPEAGEYGGAARIGHDHVVAGRGRDLRGCGCGKDAERQGAHDGQADWALNEGVFHDVPSMTSLLWLRRNILSYHLRSVGRCAVVVCRVARLACVRDRTQLTAVSDCAPKRVKWPHEFPCFFPLPKSQPFARIVAREELRGA